MKRFLLVFIFLLSNLQVNLGEHPSTAYETAFRLRSAQDVFSQRSVPLLAEGAGPVVLCLPGIHLDHPDDCTPAGPSAYLSQLAEKGIRLPLPPLPLTPIDLALSQTDLRYAEVRSADAPVYASAQEAAVGNKKTAIQHINSGFAYVSYTDDVEMENKHLYQVSPGGWMKAADITRIGVLPKSQGMTLTRTPTHAFGWILTYWVSEPLQTKRTPGNQVPDYTGRFPELYEIVSVFAETQVDQETWYLIGPDEWVQQKYVARVIPDVTPPEGVSGDRWIEVNLFEQTLAVYDHRQLVFAAIIASGAEPSWTQPGLFQIREKLESAPMTSASNAEQSDTYYLEDVPWTMYYDGPRALHGAYWRAKMGFTQSHGCVNMTIGDAHWLFNWAQTGDWVYIWDPSGQTPTDPKLYGSGGY